MRKAYKRIISTAMVLSIVIQGNTVFAKEISNNSNNESKKLVVVYERKDSKDYLDILINGKTNKKEIKDGKLCEIVDGIDMAVVDSNKSTNLKSDMTNLIKSGAEAFIYINGENVDVFSADDVSKKISKSNESKKADSTETKKEDLKRESTSKENPSKEGTKEDAKKDTSKKVKVEITYRQKNSSNELISLKTATTVSSSEKEESKTENRKEEDKNNSNQKPEQDKEENKDENKDEVNFNNEDVLGKTSTELVGDYYTIGKEESNFANLINDTLLSKTGAEIAMTNAGTILKSIPKGDITYGDIVESVIFGNTVITKKLTGKQIKDAIEVGAEIYPEANSTFLHFGNLTYTIDVNKKAGSRITDIKVKGKKLDESKQYLVAMNDYMSTDYSSISGANIEKNYGELDKVIAEFIKSKGTVNYKNDGRIKVTKTVNINREKVKKVVTAIDKLTYDKTTSNIKAVNEAIKMFNDLNQDERKQVTNYKKLVKIADTLRNNGASVNKPSGTGSSSSSSSSGSKTTQKSPKTGDTSSLVGAAGTFVASAVAFGALRRKKEDE
ncbi:5'-nucleotidase C-terminal domain-containing protein [Peptacetobacter sp.]|uniref:5'-nucleotidase C-terminal domain-containing protein n=1 Tax=Peptacetobacter sp. TaxID=2991975 RepID=UPI0026080CCC|nr:5'-nucleotidase C-terminal domain-containing protein [Peptacetobacter sp.]